MSISPSKAEQLGNLDKTHFQDENVIATQYDAIEAEESNNIIKCMKRVVKFFKSNAPVTIQTPFKGTCLKINKAETKFYFSSRGGRIGIADPTSQEVIADEKISESPIWYIALSQDEKFIYAGGDETVINKYSLPELVLVDTFVGHSSAINSIIVSADDKWIFSASDDATVRMWSIHNKKDKVLYKTKGVVYSMDLSLDNRYVCSGGSDNTLFVYELNDFQTGKLIQTINTDVELWAVKFSPSASFVTTGDMRGTIKLFRIFTWELIAQFEHGERVRSIDVSISELVLVSTGINNLIKIWDLTKNSKEITLSKHTGWVKSGIITQNQDKIVSISDDKFIIVWKMPEFEQIHPLKTENLTVNQMWFSTETFRFEALCKTSDGFSVCGWDSEGFCSQLLLINQQDVLAVTNTKDYKELIIAGKASQEEVFGLNTPIESYYNISIYSVARQQKLRLHFLDLEMQSIYISNDSKYCLIGGNFKIIVFNYQNFEKLSTIFAHNGAILMMITNLTSNFLFSYGTDTLIKKFDLTDIERGNEITEMFTTTKTKSNWAQADSCGMEISDDDKLIYIASLYDFEVYEIRNMNIIIHIDELYNGVIKNLNNCIFLAKITGFDVYSSRNFQILSNFEKNYKIRSVILSPDKKDFYIKTNDELLRIPNPLWLKTYSLLGDPKELDKFKDHVMEVIKKKSNTPYYGNWLIEPVHINLLHLYSYFNCSDRIKDAIKGNENNRIAVISSKYNHTPVTISLEMKFDETLHSIIVSIRKLVKDDKTPYPYKKFLFQQIEESLTDLNTMGYRGLHKLYKDTLITTMIPGLPNFCDRRIKLPLFVKSEHYFPASQEFNLSDEIPDNSTAIIFKNTLMRFYMVMGSERSLAFIRSIEDCPNEEIFLTTTVKLILTEKWKEAQWFMWIQAFLYVCYLVLLSLYNSYDPLRTSLFLIAPFTVSAVLYSYELVFVFLNVLDYFSDFWNVVDSIRAWLMIGYCVLIWLDYFAISYTNQSDERYFFAALLFVSWARGITYFRINASTRYLIKLIFQVLGDVIPFLIILLYSVVGFGLAFYVVNWPATLVDYFDSLTTSYLVVIAGWEDPKETDIYCLIIFLSTLLNPIINLNLLISILGDTYGEVSENQEIADAQELTSMIAEIETLMFWNRKKNFKTFLQTVEEDCLDNVDDTDISQQVSSVRTKIFYLQENFKDSKKSLSSLKKQIEEKSDDIMRELKSLNRK